MPKWTSPLFTDIRNALGESVVFSMWKGRTYLRTWVRPANPQTLKQQANRDIMRNLVARWQEIAATEEVKSAWTAAALPYQITGHNLWTKYGMKSSISCPSTGNTSTAVTITYTSGVPAGSAAVYAVKGEDITDITPAAGLQAGSGKTFSHTFSTAGIYTLYIAAPDILAGDDTGAQPYQAISCWSRDETQGVAKTATITVT